MSFFLLRNAIFLDDRSCTFDATARESELIHTSTREQVTDFLRVLGVAAAPVDWSVETFCSQYFSHFPDSKSFRDRFTQAWRFRVRLDRAVTPTARANPFEPVWSDALDSTWRPTDDDPDPFEWTTLRCFVIGDFLDNWPEREDEVVRDATLAPLSREVLTLGPGAVQVRYDLGKLAFPDDEPRAQAVHAALTKLATSTSHRRSANLATVRAVQK